MNEQFCYWMCRNYGCKVEFEIYSYNINVKKLEVGK